MSRCFLVSPNIQCPFDLHPWQPLALVPCCYIPPLAYCRFNQVPCQGGTRHSQSLNADWFQPTPPVSSLHKPPYVLIFSKLAATALVSW